MNPLKHRFLTGSGALFLICLSLWIWPGFVSFAAANPPSVKRPNILLAIADDWSYGHAGAYGCSWVKTPAFDRLAQEGILFTRAFTPNAKCAPSRAIILTGRHSWQLKAAANHWCYFPPEFGSFVERLAADGYFAGFTGKGWAPGIANDTNGAPRSITGMAYQERKLTPPTKHISSEDYAANFKDFLEEAPDGQPWVFWYGAREPHRGYEYKSGLRFGKKRSDIARVPGYWPDNEITRNDMLDYAVEVEHFDNHLGRILNILEQMGQLENTLIVATSDHGMPFPRVKGQAYDESNHVPLAVRWPKGIVGSGRTASEFVDFTDLAPTFLEAAGISDPSPIMQPITGQSLLDIFSGSNAATPRGHILIGKERHDVGRPDDAGYPIRGIRQGDWLYIRNFEVDRWPSGNPETGYLNCDGGPVKSNILDLRRSGENTNSWNLCFGKRPAEELYNLQDDPDGLKNLAASAEHKGIVAKLRTQMETELKAQGDPRMVGKGNVFDNYPSANLKTKNFYNRYMQGEPLRAPWVNETDFETNSLAE